jgi:hypothetical protein
MLRNSLRILFVCGVAASVAGAVSCSSGPTRKPAGTTGAAGNATGAAGNATGAAGDPSGAAGSTTGAAGDPSGAAGNATGAAGDPSGAAGAQGAAGDGAAAGTQGAAGDTGNGAAGTSGAAGTGVDNTPTIPLPITVTSQWHPSGYYGDEYQQPLINMGAAPMTMAVSSEGPCGARVAGALGDCYKVVYTPQALEGGVPGYAGVAFLGTLPGGSASNFDMPLVAPRPEQGATKVTAQIAGAAGGELVELTVGNSFDAFQEKVPATITKAWTEVTIPVGSYDHLVMGYGWVSASPTPITFYLDNIVLKK